MRGTFHPAASCCIWSRLLSPVFWQTASSEREKALTKRGGSIFETAMSMPPCHRVFRNPFQTSTFSAGISGIFVLCAAHLQNYLLRFVRRRSRPLWSVMRCAELNYICTSGDAEAKWAQQLIEQITAWLLVKLRLMLHCLLLVQIK